MRAIITSLLILIVGLAEAQSFQSNLPIVEINTNGQNITDVSKVNVSFNIIYNGPNQLNNSNSQSKYFKGKVGIKIHGSSSKYLSPKKSYAYTIIDGGGNSMDTSLLGFPRQSSYVLVANYFDKTLLRTMLAYRIGAEMGDYAPRYRFVEVILNGDYKGVYLLVESIKRDKNRVDIAKMTRNDLYGSDLTGGYILKVDRPDGTGTDGWFDKYKKDPADSVAAFFCFEYPSMDSILQTQKEYIKSYIDSFETALLGPSFKDSAKGYRNFIDPTSFADKMIVNEVSKNPDGYRLSEYFYKEKDSKKNGRGLLYDGPVWDYDISWSNFNMGNATNPYRWQYQEKEGRYYSPVWWRKLMEDQYFKNELYCRYTEARKFALQLDHLNHIIDSTASAIKDARDRNFNRWPIMKDTLWNSPLPIPGDYDGEISVLKTWLKNRVDWMDKQIKGNCNPKYAHIHVSTDVASMDGETQVAVYPNPFNSNVLVKITNPKGAAEIKIQVFNTIGLKVYGSNTPGNPSETNLSVNLKSLPAGIYFLNIEQGEFVTSKKIIKSE